MMSFEEFKKLADDYFSRMTPKDMVKRFEKLGYEFVDIDAEEDEKNLAPFAEKESISFEVIQGKQANFPLRVEFSYTIIAA